MNFSIAFYLFAIMNILISFIGIGEAGDVSDSEIPKEETQQMRTLKEKLPANEEYECSSAHVPDLSEADYSIATNFSQDIYLCKYDCNLIIKYKLRIPLFPYERHSITLFQNMFLLP